ncbi:MAG: hypothetical protein ACM3Q1_11340 [Bacteroidales bacterium]
MPSLRRAEALQLGGHSNAAIREYEACLKLDGGQIKARMNLALLYSQSGRPDKAVEHARIILSQAPLHAGAVMVLCVAARQTQKIPELLPFLNRVIEPLLAAPPSAEPAQRDRHHYAVASICEVLERHADAARHFLQARSMPAALSMGLRLKGKICDWTDFDRLTRELERQAADRPQDVAPLAFIALSDDPALHRRVAAANAERLARIPPLPPQPQHSRPRLRVGYLSADFRAHPVAYLVADTIAHHDRDRFEVFLYSCGPDDGSDWRRRFAGMGTLTDIRRMADQEAAQRIAQDGIDVLVDLTGLTGMNRLPILAHRPAKVAINWLGYPGTLGCGAVDYIIADRQLIPPTDERHYAEAVIRLPVTYQPSSRDRAPTGEVTAERPAAGFVLSAFNQTFKITPGLFDIWCRLLRHRDDAILWLYATDDNARANLRREASARGVSPDRLVFATAAPLAVHMARYRHVDLQLDTFPYGGHTTTSDALMMGCPVLALRGASFPARVAASLLSAVGLDDFVCASAAAYERKAMEVLDDPGLLADARARIVTNGHILFQPERFCRELECAYTTAMERWHAGLKPAPFDVPAQGADRAIYTR